MVWTSSSRVSLRTVELLIMMVEKSDAANVQECGSPRAEVLVQLTPRGFVRYPLTWFNHIFISVFDNDL